MFDANVLAGMRIGPARDIARGIDAGYAGFEIGIDGDAAIDRKPRLLGQSKARDARRRGSHGASARAS